MRKKLLAMLLAHLLAAEGEQHPQLGLYLLRPPVVLGPHTIGGKDLLPGRLAPLGRRLAGRFGPLPVPVPAFVPAVQLQLIGLPDEAALAARKTTWKSRLSDLAKHIG